MRGSPSHRPVALRGLKNPVKQKNIRYYRVYSNFVSRFSFIFLLKVMEYFLLTVCPVDWGCRIHRLLLCRGIRLPQRVSVDPVGRSFRIHRLLLCRGVRLSQRESCDPVSWSCRIHRLLLCRGVRLPQREYGDQVVGSCRIHRLLLCKGVRLS